MPWSCPLTKKLPEPQRRPFPVPYWVEHLGGFSAAQNSICTARRNRRSEGVVKSSSRCSSPPQRSRVQVLNTGAHTGTSWGCRSRCRRGNQPARRRGPFIRGRTSWCAGRTQHSRPDPGGPVPGPAGLDHCPVTPPPTNHGSADRRSPKP